MVSDERVSILIVEDDLDQQYLLEQILKYAPRKVHHAPDQAYLVATAKTFEEMTQYLSHNNPQLILLDLNLPDSKELNTLLHLRKHHADIAIIVITGIDNEEIEYQAMRSGAQEYLVKGRFPKEELLRSINHALFRREQINEIELERKKLASALERAPGEASDASESEDLISALIQTKDEDSKENSETLLTRIENLANYDIMTKLPNRVLFEKKITESLHHAIRYKHAFSVLFVDLDHFKTINDSYGYDVGDMLLTEIASRIQGCLDKTGFLARFGGDEFGLILSEADEASAKQIAKKINEACKTLFNLKEQEVHTSVSIGAAVFPGAGANVLELMQHADMALYRVKKHGRNDVQFFKLDVDGAHKRLLAVENELRFAIEKQELRLVYQPIVTLKNRNVTGFEVLLRWKSSILGDVSSDEFIPIAEATGLIFDITLWVAEQACQQLQIWREKHNFDSVLSINISSLDTLQANLPKRLFSTLDKYKLPRSSLQIELTETAIMQDEFSGEEILKEISSGGIKIAIDDFGTGYASLRRIKNLPISILKIDRSFVKNVIMSERDCQIVKSILLLTKAFDLETVAEGVESEAVASYLFDLGCQFAQGYCFARPIDAENVINYVQGREVIQTDEVLAAELQKQCLELRAIGHDINNVLAGILGYCDLMLSVETHPHPQEELTKLHVRIENMLRLTKALSIQISDIQAQELSRQHSQLKLTLDQYVILVSDQLKQLSDEVYVNVQALGEDEDLSEGAARFQQRIADLLHNLYALCKKLREYS
jgi:diguanylate cyclase (GGDEF)-like protein